MKKDECVKKCSYKPLGEEFKPSIRKTAIFNLTKRNVFFVIKYYSACYEQTILNSPPLILFLLDSNSFASVEEAVDDCGHDRIQCQAQCTEIWKKCNDHSKAINHNYSTSSACLKFFSKWNCYKRMGKKQLIFSNFWALCKAHHPKCLDGETLCKCKLDFICLDNNGKETGVSTSGLTGSQSGQTFGSITVIIVSLVSSILTTAITNIYFYRLTMMMWILVRLAMITLTMKNLTNPQ